jgi:hypothetical protein
VFLEALRRLLGDSIYDWTLQMGQMLEALWDSRLFWRLATLLLLIWLLARFRRRAR